MIIWFMNSVLKKHDWFQTLLSTLVDLFIYFIVLTVLYNLYVLKCGCCKNHMSIL